MQGRDHKQLRTLVERYESHSHMRAMQTYSIAILGLIGFGLFSIPVLTISIPAETLMVAERTEAPVRAFPTPHIVAEGALVYDLSTRTPLYEKNAHEIMPLASLTKLITVYAALSELPPDTAVTITREDLAPDGDTGFVEGERYSARSLEHLALVSSSNDAAQAITEAIAERQQKSGSDLLANVITALGLVRTRANNSTGLDISLSESGAYGDAYDVATLAGAIVSKDAKLASATTRSAVSITSLDGRTLSKSNTNHYIGAIPNPLLSKTGYTDLAGGNLVVVFDAGMGHHIAVVVLGSTYDARFTDVEELVRKTLAHLAPPSIAP